MKTLKTLAFVSLLTLSLTQTALAVWWNPFSWQWGWFKREIETVNIVNSFYPSAIPTDTIVDSNSLEFKNTVKLKETAVFEDAKITPSLIMKDERCSVGSECTQSGKFEVQTVLKVKQMHEWEGKIQKVEHVGSANAVIGKPFRFFGKKITLVEVTPEPNLKTAINNKDYGFKFSVEDFITLTEPNISISGDQVIKPGEHDIKWKGTDIGNIIINVQRVRGNDIATSGAIKFSAGSYKMKIPEVEAVKGEQPKYALVIKDTTGVVLMTSNPFIIGCTACASEGQ